MDVIEAHVRRLPALDHRWIPRPYTRRELAAALLDGQVAGVATHPLDNVRGNIAMMLEGDPDKQFGLRGLAGALSFAEILDLVAHEAGAPIAPDQRFGDVHIDPGPVIDASAALGQRLARAAASRERVLIATGHPSGLVLLYRELGRLLAAHGGAILTPADGDRWRDPGLDHDWHIAYLSGVAMLTDGRSPRHTHRPDAMERMLASGRPDLVLADHGFAGAAIEAGVETVSVADVNDPALIVAKAQGWTEIVLVMDDHVAQDAYWPCFQAAAAAFPQVSDLGPK